VSSFWVRPATAADARAVRDLARRVGREFRVAPRRREYGAAPGSDDLAWVVEAGRGKIVGSCALRDAEDGSWELHSLNLEPDWRGFGLGRSLVEHALRVARGAGALSVVCLAPPEFAEARTLLERLGFRDTGRTHASGEAALEVVFTLAS